MTGSLIAVEDLAVTMAGVPVVDGVSFGLEPGEMLGLVGESGCGKTVTALSLMRLVPDPPGRIAAGRILFEGTDLVEIAPETLRRLRGDRIGMIFQEPMTSLNPVFTIGDQIAETLEIHRDPGRAAARAAAVDLLRLVGLPAPERQLDRYPHQLSGGQRQRVMIAIAIACRPRLLIADEPTTALDVTVQAQILNLLDGLRRETGMAMLLITHDLGVVAEFCDRVAVMYAGKIVEEAPVAALFAHPRHPYTAGLLGSMPARVGKVDRLPVIPGAVPPPGERGPGCRFAPRCDFALSRCAVEQPPLEDGVACWNPR